MAAQRDYRMTVLAGSAVEPDERLDEFLRYWRRIRGTRTMPRRADIDPIDIPKRLLPSIFLTDVIDGGARFRFRLVGTAASSAIGANLTGRHVDEVNESTSYRDYITALYRRVVDERRPLFSMSRYFKTNDDYTAHHATQRLMCPVSNDDQTVNMVFTCQIFELAPRELDFPRLTAANPFTGICEAALE